MGEGGAGPEYRLRALRVGLRPVEEADVPFVRGLAMAEPNAWLTWPLIASQGAPDEFGPALMDAALCHFVVTLNVDDRPIGYCVADRADLDNGHAHIGVFLGAEHQGRGFGAEAGGLLLAHLFQRYPLRKVYGTAYDTGLPTRGWGRLFGEEACLRQHCWFRGRYWDEHVLAVSREDFERLASRFLARRQR